MKKIKPTATVQLAVYFPAWIEKRMRERRKSKCVPGTAEIGMRQRATKKEMVELEGCKTVRT